MIIHASESTKIPIPEGTIWDYPLPKKEIGISCQTLDGRCPRKGKYCNTVCHEIYFIIRGKAKVYMKDEQHDVGKGDIIIVEPNTPHYLEANNLQFITITRPNWYEEQYKIVDM